MTVPCECCSGIEKVTPELETSRPGLPEIPYRAGTYATFFETMLARLSNLYLDVPAVDGSGSLTRLYPLKQLTTRDSSDPAIALLDVWAVVADVLTFYEERIANEGYLVTATERLSLLELARLIGYKLRPGVSASVYLAFTVAKDFQGIIPAGTRAQSIPAAGQTAQFFETSVDLPARDTWNDLKPRLTRPQVITLGDDGPNTGKPFDPGLDGRTRGTLYFKGISTNLKTGDALLIVTGDGLGQQALRFVASVDAQADEERTEVTLQESPFPVDTGSQVIDNVRNAVGPFIDEAADIFAGIDFAQQVSSTLRRLLGSIDASDGTPQAGIQLIEAVVPQIQEIHDVALKRKFTRLEPWVADLLSTLKALIEGLPNQDISTVPPGGPPVSAPPPIVASPLTSLTAILQQLALPRSVQPANSARLGRTVTRTFSPQADTAPQLLAAFNPPAAGVLYKAWANIELPAPAVPVQVYAMRVKAAPFGNNAPLQPIVPKTGDPVGFQEWKLSGNESSFTLSLDSTYDKILTDGWVVINRTDSHISVVPPQTFITQITGAQTVSRADYGMSARVTQLVLNLNWMAGFPTPPPANDISVLRGTTVWAQSELLELAEEPLDRDVAGSTIELDGLYNGLETGRWIIVSGERTDITDSTGSTTATGVEGNELVMIAGVTQGAGKQSCLAFTTRTIPFTSIYYVTDANADGDRLVVGVPAALPSAFLDPTLLPVPNAPNEQICNPVQLAPGFYANAYVPTAAERGGDFSAFGAAIPDPDPSNKGANFPGGKIPSNRLDPNNRFPVFAWRISSVASGTDTVHTSLVLANALAYKYDSASATIYANVVNATHGQSTGEVLGDGDASQPFDAFAVHQKPLTYVSAATPDGAQSTLVVRVNEIAWHEQTDLAALGPRHRSYFTQTDDADQTSVVFGNGEHGARVPTGSSNIKATYRYGIGSAGNVDAGQISQLATHPLGAQAVINPLAASGGADRDSLDQARRNAPVGVMALDRLVSVDDYGEFARTYAGIGKASAVRLSDGLRQLVHVTIAGAGDIPIDRNSDLYRNLVRSLLQFGDPYQPLQVCPRKVQLLVISADFQILPDYAWESVEPRIRAALLDKFSFDNRALGQSAFQSEAVAVMQSIAGVSYVDVKTFDAVREDVTAAQLAGLASSLKTQNHVLAQLPRLNLDFDPATDSDSCDRILPAELVFLSPDIADTLILNQVGASQ
jgi:hypothetical protein